MTKRECPDWEAKIHESLQRSCVLVCQVLVSGGFVTQRHQMNRSLRRALDILPWILFAYCSISLLVNPTYFTEVVVAKDSKEGSGVVEYFTVLVLVAGIGCGMFGLIRYWRLIPSVAHRLALTLWLLACIYFAGEEVSWGQWYFDWQTPEVLSEINKQNETNLHNISSWLNEKPRTLVELWILFAGLIVGPGRLMGYFHYSYRDLREWINPYSIGLSTCLVFLISKCLEFFPYSFTQMISNSEIRELLIAYFLSLYLFSALLKLRRKHQEENGEGLNSSPGKSTEKVPSAI